MNQLSILFELNISLTKHVSEFYIKLEPVGSIKPTIYHLKSQNLVFVSESYVSEKRMRVDLMDQVSSMSDFILKKIYPCIHITELYIKLEPVGIRKPTTHHLKYHNLAFAVAYHTPEKRY